MVQQFLGLAMAALCGWAGWSMRRPGESSISRMLGLTAFAGAAALLDDALGWPGVAGAALRRSRIDL